MDEIPIIHEDSGSLYSNREYLIFNVSEIPLVDFNSVMETSPDTLEPRHLLNGNHNHLHLLLI
jgi:hypothetical protein